MSVRSKAGSSQEAKRELQKGTKDPNGLPAVAKYSGMNFNAEPKSCLHFRLKSSVLLGEKGENSL